jgi:MFS family permease
MPASQSVRSIRGHLLGSRYDYRFRRLAVSHALDSIGNTLAAIAMAGTLFFSIPTGEARSRVLLYLVLTVAPFAIVSAFLGPLLDRGMGFRRLAVISVGLGRAVITWMMATRTSSLLLFPLALGVLVGQRLYSITRSSLVPVCLPADEPLVSANSFLVRTSAIAGFVTALWGVGIHQLFRASGVLRVASVAYLLMGLAGFLLPVPRRSGRRSRARGPSPEKERVDTERAFMLRPGTRAIAGLRALSGFLLFMLAFSLRREGASATRFGGLLLGIGVGAFLSSLCAPVLNRHIREDLLVFTAVFGSGATAILAAQVYTVATAGALAAVVGAAFGIGKLAFDSMAQRGLPRRVQGRVFARWETVFQLSWVSGALLPVAVSLPTRPTLVVVGVATVIGSFAYAVDVSRARRAGLSHVPATSPATAS